jgi:rubrerythrin
MAEFVNPFSGVTPDRKISFRELTRAIRLSLSAEQEAIHLYEAIADSTDNALAKAVLQEVANEERVHAGEFQRLLNILLSDEEKLMTEGAGEVDEIAQGGKGGESEPVKEQSPSISTIGNMKA